MLCTSIAGMISLPVSLNSASKVLPEPRVILSTAKMRSLARCASGRGLGMPWAAASRSSKKILGGWPFGGDRARRVKSVSNSRLERLRPWCSQAAIMPPSPTARSMFRSYSTKALLKFRPLAFKDSLRRCKQAIKGSSSRSNWAGPISRTNSAARKRSLEMSRRIVEPYPVPSKDVASKLTPPPRLREVGVMSPPPGNPYMAAALGERLRRAGEAGERSRSCRSIPAFVAPYTDVASKDGRPYPVGEEAAFSTFPPGQNQAQKVA
mmetsp:Transcript_3587/g.8107  ORF Transcript_3587/g.8107 Transcript_3587/m.8107 type:complete len:265 (-) Transcript_3587:871-1665(-)